MTEENKKEEEFDPNLSADSSPEGVEGNAPIIRRPNKLALVLGGGIIGISIISFLVLYDPEPVHSKKTEETSKGDTSEQALEGRLKDLNVGVIEQEESLPLPKNGVVSLEQKAPSPLSFEAPPPIINERSPNPTPILKGDENQLQNQIEQQKTQMLQQAITLPSAVSFNITPPPASSQTGENDAAINAQIPTFDPAEKPALPNAERIKRWGIETQKEAAKSPYTLRTGFVIPAVLTVGINSDSPGQTQAIVSQNVYDTATGKYLLIPQGAKLIGSYQSAPAYGSKRLSVMWERILFPDGSSMDIGGMQGTDFAGTNGVQDQINNHWWRTLTAAFLMSVLQAPGAVGSALTMSGSSANGGMMSNLTYGGGNAAQMVASQTGSALSAPFSRSLNSSPTLIIRQGYPLNVMVNKDLEFTKAYSLKVNKN